MNGPRSQRALTFALINSCLLILVATSTATYGQSFNFPTPYAAVANALTDMRLGKETKEKPVIHVADGMDPDGQLVTNYRRGLRYATDYFGNYGPYHVYLLGPKSELSVRAIFRERAESHVNPQSPVPAEKQIAEFLKRRNVIEEIDAVLSGKAAGGLTWTQDPPYLYEDVTTNATERAQNPTENIWGAMHEYHHVFQIAHCDTKHPRSSDRHINSWIAEGMASYSSAKFMDNLGLVDFEDYMLKLRKSGGNIGQPGINDFIAKNKSWKLDNETYWENDGPAPQVYYMLGAWATAYLIHVEGVDEKVVLRNWYHDIPRIGKSAAFQKHMGLTLKAFYKKFDDFIRQSDEEAMKIFEKKQ